jgi:acyl-CoA dehydrogenase
MISRMTAVRRPWRARSPWASDEHELFRETARAWIERKILPNDERWQARGYVDPELWRSAGEAGLLGTDVPVEHGGLGGDFGFECVIYEELLHAGFACFGKGVHEIATHYVLDYGTGEQRAAWMPRLVSGELVGAIAMTEPGAGSDLRGISTSAVRDGDHYVVNGSKTFVTNGLHASLICLVVRSDFEAASQGYTLLMVETEGLSGFTRGQPLHKLGQHAQDTCELHFSDCRVPVGASLGEGQGLYQLMQQLPYERTVVAVMAVSALERVIADTVAYAHQRQAFGKPLMALQNTRFKLAEAHTAATIGRVFVDHCITRVIDGTLDTVTASMAKWWLTDQQWRHIDECLQLFGGYGYMLEYPVARAFLDARVQTIYAGSNEIMKEIVARSLEHG